jgi:hypothetical protein
MDGAVSRSALMAALVSSSAADQSCRAALANGAGFDVRGSAEGPVVELVRIYERRVRHVLATCSARASRPSARMS